MADTARIQGPSQRACINLRGEPSTPFRDGVATALGVDLPVVPCTFGRAGERTIYWLGPNEWLATAPAGAEDTMEADLRAVLTGGFAVTDVSGAWLSFSLSGGTAADVLRKSSPCDFHPRAFTPGRCVQTAFAKATALIAHQADGTFEVLVRTSYGAYLARWLEAAVRDCEAST